MDLGQGEGERGGLSVEKYWDRVGKCVFKFSPYPHPKGGLHRSYWVNSCLKGAWARNANMCKNMASQRYPSPWLQLPSERAVQSGAGRAFHLWSLPGKAYDQAWYNTHRFFCPGARLLSWKTECFPPNIRKYGKAGLSYYFYSTSYRYS